jgi:TetR/AcrR family transcriptional repressor of nem operon
VEKGERTRRRILEKAAPIFNSKGYSGTALTDLMEATGLQKGGIYRHFDSKQDLAAAAFDYAWSVASAPRFAALQEGHSGVDHLKAMVFNFAEKHVKTIPGGCPLLNTAVEADDTNPVLRARVKAALGQWITHVKDAVKQGIHEKQINANADPSQVAVVLISTLEGALMISRLEGDRETLEMAKKHLLQFIDSLTNEKGATPQKTNR